MTVTFMGNSLPRCPPMRRSPLQTTSFAIAEEEEEEEVPPARRVLGASEVRREDEVGDLMDKMDNRDLPGLRGLRGEWISKLWRILPKQS